MNNCTKCRFLNHGLGEYVVTGGDAKTNGLERLEQIGFQLRHLNNQVELLVAMWKKGNEL